MIYRRGLSKEAYQEFRSEGVARHFNVYPTYNDLRGYRQTHLRPQGIFESDKCIQVPVQSICDWQLERLFIVEPDVKAEAIGLIAEGWKVHCLIKYGADGCGNNSDYADTGDGSQKTLLASVLQFVGLRAELFDENGIRIEYKDLWINPLLNSWMSVIPIRYSMEPENIGK